MRKIQQYRRIALAALMPLSLWTVAPARAADAPVFEADILPLFEARCASCHSPDADELKGGLDLSTLASALKGGKTGASIVPGDAAGSRLVALIEGREDPAMPPKNFKRLTGVEIELVKKWINAGAKGDGSAPMPAAAKPTTAAKPAGDSKPGLSEKPAPAKPDAKAAFQKAMDAEIKPESAAKSATSDKPAKPSPIASIAFSPDGEWIAKGALHTVTLMRREASPDAPPVILDGHAEMVRAVRFSPDGKLIAAAGGQPARGGEIKIWNVADHSLVREIKGHGDCIYDVVFSPDGKRMATCSYDKLVKIWSVETGEELHNLKDHVDGVYCLAFSPDGKRLASGAGDRTVKVWDAETGARIITFSDSLDSVLAVAFSPDGARVAAGGADKMIRVWDLERSLGAFTQSSVTGSTMIKAAFAHDAAVLRLLYSPDGARLYTASEDRTLKIWNAETMLEEKSLPGQSDWITSMALSPDGKWLAVGRYDATGEILNAADGASVASIGRKLDPPVMVADAGAGRKKVTNIDVDNVVINAQVPASLQSLSPSRVARGTTVTIELRGISLDDPELLLTNPGMKARLTGNEKLPIPELKRAGGETGAFIIDNAQPHKLTVELFVPADTPVGDHFVMLRTPHGITEPQKFTVAPRPDAGDAEPNDAADKAQAIDIPIILNGSINAAGDVDFYKFHAKAGQEIVFALTDAALDAPTLTVLDADARELADSESFSGADARSPRVGHRFEAEGDYTLRVREQGLGAGGYRLNAGEFPFVASYWPLGVQAGQPRAIRVQGFNLGGVSEIQIDSPDAVEAETKIALPIPGFEGNPIAGPVLAVGPDPQLEEVEPNDAPGVAQPLVAPVAVNGRVERFGNSCDEDLYRFKAAKDQKIIIEVMARRLGSPLDSYLEILKPDGSPLERATIRCVAETIMALSDRDSRGAAIRLAEWSQLKIYDYVMIGAEIIRVRQIPDYADEDVQFNAWPSGQRRGYFGTTPQYHAVDTKVYKVEPHPPGVVFPPNGMPVHHLDWVNDDTDFEGEPSGDSLIEFTPPADGEYLVRVTDANRRGGPDFGYRLLLRPERPGFDIVAGPYWVNVADGQATSINVRARRRDNFDEPIQVRAEDIPTGYEITSDVILPGEDDCSLALRAKPGAANTPYRSTFRIVAKSTLGGAEISREARIGDITVRRAPDIAVAPDRRELEVRPGESVTVTARVERKTKFDGRAPIDVVNLPFGVYVLDTGLNGILVRDGETERPMQIFVEPWVKPMTRKIYLQARIETRSTQPLVLSEPIDLKIIPAGEKPQPAAPTVAALSKE